MTIRNVRTAPLMVALALVLACATTARAQGFLNPFIGFNFGGDASCPEITGCEDKKLNLGVSIGKMGKVLGFEEEFGYAKDFFGSAPGLESSVLTVMSNLMIVPDLGPVRPYVLAGVGLMKSHVDISTLNVLTSNNNSFGWDVGGGVMALFGGHAGVRADLRYFHAFQDLEILGFALENTKLDFGRVNVGLLLTF
jgi:opacity protein-like surface antigen